ncbi:MAG TPA: hypothetical protein VGK93_08140 [Candidatus Eisenbacteria bacterium]|jgi:hypothetical protein
MIHTVGQWDPPIPRLIGALAAGGHPVSAEAAPTAAGAILVLGSGTPPPGLDDRLGRWRVAGGRILVLSALGVHPDARAPRLRRLWQLEERARETGAPLLTLRLGPLVGPRSPLWLRLRSAPRLPHAGRALLNPLAEADAIETLKRAAQGHAEWRGWYELAGREVWSLAELGELALRAGPRLPRGSGAWEPPLAELDEHRLAEPDRWLSHFQLEARPLIERAAEWAA